MANLRTGLYGEYYGSTFDRSESLNSDQMQINAKYITRFLTAKGWSKNAIAGMLGNMQVESSLNPGRWQSDRVGDYSNGYGLVQWTPATNYTSWCTAHNLSDPSKMDNNLNRIIYELNNNLQWITTDEYPLTFKDFTTSQESPGKLASVFLKNYERAGVEIEEVRRNNAESWYEFIKGINPGEDGYQENKKKDKKRFKFHLFKRRYF